MKDVPENELFSAYLDGELTAEEQAQVERLLATSPAARQLMEELRALSATLQTMPQYKLDEDLSERVLRAAERRILTEPRQPSRPAITPGKAVLRRLLNRRVLFWPGVAVAVALMLMLFNQNPQAPPAGNRVAMAPEPPEKAEVGDSIEAGAELARKTEKIREKRAVLVGDRPASQTLVVDGTATRSAALSESAPAGPSGKTARGPAVGAALETPIPKKSVRGAELADKKPSTPGKGGAGADDFAKDVRDANVGLKTSQYAKLGNGRGSGQTQHDLQRGLGSAAQLAINRLRGYRAGQAAEITTGVVIVDVTAEAAGKQTFDKLLPENKIAWETTTATPAADLSHTRQTATKAERSKELLSALQQLNVQSASQTQDNVAVTLAELADAGNVDLVWVAATPSQIEGTLASLTTRPESFASVMVQPAPGVEQQKQWSRYNRSSVSGRVGGGVGQTQGERVHTKPDTGFFQTQPSEAPADEAAPREKPGDADRDHGPQGVAWRFPLSGAQLNSQVMMRYHSGDLDEAVRRVLPPAVPGPSPPEAAPPPDHEAAAVPTPMDRVGKWLAKKLSEGLGGKMGKMSDTTDHPATPNAMPSPAVQRQPKGQALEPAPPSSPAIQPQLGPVPRPAKESMGLGVQSGVPGEEGASAEDPMRRAIQPQEDKEAQAPTAEQPAAEKPHRVMTEPKQEPEQPPAEDHRPGGQVKAKSPAGGPPRSADTGSRQSGAMRSALAGRQQGESRPSEDSQEVTRDDAGGKSDTYKYKGKSDASREQKPEHPRRHDRLRRQEPTYLMLFVLRTIEPDVAAARAASAVILDASQAPAAEAAEAAELEAK